MQATNTILSAGTRVSVWELDDHGNRKSGTVVYRAPGFGYGIALDGEIGVSGTPRVDEWLDQAVRPL